MTNTKTVTKGTCGACFRTMVLNAHGRIVRHGWREVGVRKVGDYGNVWHSGTCFGSAWHPFETSTDCTNAFLTDVLFPMSLRADAAVEWIATNPPLIYAGRTHSRDWRTPKGEGAWEAMVKFGDAETRANDHADAYYSSRIPAYAALHENATKERVDHAAGVRADALYCLDRVAKWAPATVAVVARKVKLVHAVNTRAPRWAACGKSLRGSWGTVYLDVGTGDDVTCEKCRAVLAKHAVAPTA